MIKSSSQFLSRISAYFRAKKKQYITAFILIFLSLLLSAIYFLTGDQRSFTQYLDRFLVSELTGNTLNMHYSVADPLSFGIKDYEAVLPAYSGKKKEVSGTELDRSVKDLKRISRSRLNSRDSYTYDLLLSFLKQEQLASAYPYYSNPLSPSSGMQSQLPILLAEYTFRTKRDVDDYLAILSQTEGYFKGLADYLKEQADAGLFMPDYAVDKVIEQCDTIMDAGLLNEQKHFLNTTFEERLDQLLKKELITEEEKEAYLSNNDRILTTIMLPAYQKLGDELILLKGRGKNEQGLYYYPEGREYYELLLKRTTGTNRPIQEIKELLFEDFSASYDAMVALLAENKELLTLREEPPFTPSAPTDMLKNLQQMMTSDFPPLNGLVSNQESMPVCTVKSISPNLQDYCSPAFYLTPPFDDIRSNVIYINQKNNPQGVDLYTTLAHEGYPGHLYQTVYSQLYMQKSQIHPIRSLLSYGGYVEGWAMYVELNSYDYAKSQVPEQDSFTKALYESYRLNRKIQLSIYSLLDIAIHYEGANYEQVHNILASIGIQDAVSTRSIYEYIAEEPATYPKYYLGYLEILKLKTEAKEKWGDAYSEYRFHQFYLENGPADFGNLRKQLEKSVS